jgi:hypothetical protein
VMHPVWFAARRSSWPCSYCQCYPGRSQKASRPNPCRVVVPLERVATSRRRTTMTRPRPALTIDRVRAMKKPAQDASGTTIETSGDLQVPPISRLAHPHRSLSSLNVMETFRAVEDGVDAAVPVDAKNASTSDLENYKDRSFPQRPHRLFFSRKKKPEERTTKQKLQVCQFRLSQRRGSPQLASCAHICAPAHWNLVRFGTK